MNPDTIDPRISSESATRVAVAFGSITDMVADGSSLDAACMAHNLTRAMVRRYMAGNPEARASFDIAREQQTEALFDQLHTTINDTKMDPRLQANRIKALTWMIEKRDPAKYGQRSTVDLTLKAPDMAKALAEGDRRYAALLAGRSALALPAIARVLSPAPEASDAVWAELVG